MRPIFKNNKMWIALFVTPATVVFTFIIIIPLIQSFGYSFFEWNGISTGDFVGIANYKRLFLSKELPISLKNSLIYSLILTIYQVGLGTVIASVLINTKIKGTVIYRNIYFVPVLLSVTVMSQMWIWIYHGDYGLINQIAKFMGMEWRQQWLNRKGSSLIAVAIADSWKGMGYQMLIIYAAMRNISRTYYEAAEIDGASMVQQFRHITLPLSAPTLRMCMIMSITYGFRAFETIHLMTGGGPGNFTYNLTILMYKAMFTMNDYGYGSAIAVVIVFICVGLLVVINKSTQNLDEIY